jgi:tRNA (guanine-N7-)-methyltransferase
MTHPSGPSRQPRAYIRRRGRMTAGQSRAFEALARYRLEPTGEPLDLVECFGRDAPLGLEIGFGMGQALLAWAERRPDWNLLGLEIYQPGVGALLLGLERLGLSNVRAIEAAAETVLESQLDTACLEEVRIFFPDPWPKTRHHKRRIIQPDFVALLADRIRPGGLLWLATDWVPYAEWMQEILAGEPRFEVEPVGAAGQEDSLQDRVQTRFEARGLRLGHEIRDLRYRRAAQAAVASDRTGGSSA